jgi:photosystem II stability/assembly factor-like uncharacterized protein
MNNKMLLAYLVVVVAFLSFAFRGPIAKENKNNASACIGSSKPVGNEIMTDGVKPRATNIIFQSKDGGQTWEDVSYGLPENEQFEGFFAGESEVYLRVTNGTYRSKSNLKTPVWVKENVLDPRYNSISFNRSGVMAFNHEGQILRKISATTWLPAYTSFDERPVRSIFETSNGTIFLGCDDGLYKSSDKGRSWKGVHYGGSFRDLAESDGILLATGQKGIMRSTDNGEHWEWVISEGGVGITVERIYGGFAAIVYNSRMMARRIYISIDGGQTWKAIDEDLRPALSISSIKQIGQYLLCGHPDGIFRSSDMGKTWTLVHSSAQKFTLTGFNPDDGKVFTIYVSGDVAYAVLKSGGC